MKKLFAAVLLLLVPCLVLCGCGKQQAEKRITDLRTDIYTAQAEGISLTAYTGKREQPFAADGTVGECRSVLFLLLKVESSGSYTVTVRCDGKEYAADFTTHPVTHNLHAVIDFTETAAQAMTAVVACGESTTELTLQKQTPTDAITYKKALSKASKHFTEQTLPAEYHVRLLRENDRFYWFCSQVTAEGSEAVLLSATDGSLIAKKSFPHG